jgi:hypothetical protein
MSPQRWQRIEELYNGALERPATERDVFLSQACDGDPDLRSTIEKLLQVPGDCILDRPAANLTVATAHCFKPAAAWDPTS